MKFEKLLAELEPKAMEETARVLLEKLGLEGARRVRSAAVGIGAQALTVADRAAESAAQRSRHVSADIHYEEMGDGVPYSGEAELPAEEKLIYDSEEEMRHGEAGERGFPDIRSNFPREQPFREPMPRVAAAFSADENLSGSAAVGRRIVEAGAAAYMDGAAKETEMAAAGNPERASIRAFSDFFKRDSRRYDKGFERY